MLLYKVIKYKILDFCLDTLFEGIQLNFNLFTERLIQAKDLKVGMLFKKIERIRNGPKWYLNCKITKIEIHNSSAMGEYMYITIETNYIYSSLKGFRPESGATIPLIPSELIKVYN